MQLDIFKHSVPIVRPDTSQKDSWTKTAYAFMLKYAKMHNQFLAEDLRLASEGIVPKPKCARSWGAVIVMANRNDIIERIRYVKVKNPNAHSAIATLWRVK
jgi:hypothetical protein